MSLLLRLPLEKDRSPVEISLSFCEPHCLLRQHETFVSALGRPRGGSVFRTSLETIIKRRSHTVAEHQFFSFDIEKHHAAFETLRHHRPPGVLIPLRECRCSYELSFIDGGIACPAGGEEAAWLKKFCCVKVLNNEADALNFIERSRDILWGLHQLGLWHGDPGYRNFIITNESKIFLIDLDNIVYAGRGAPCEYWDFVRLNLFPILREHYSLQRMIMICLRNSYPLGTLLNAIIFRNLGRVVRLFKEIKARYRGFIRNQYICS